MAELKKTTSFLANIIDLIKTYLKGNEVLGDNPKGDRKMDYSKINLDDSDKFQKTMSGSDFEMKAWKDMEEGEKFIDKMLLVGIKVVQTAKGPTSILQFRNPKDAEDKKCVWTNTILNNAIDNGDLEELDYMLYTIEYKGKKETKRGGNEYHNMELLSLDLRKLGFVSSQEKKVTEILKDDKQAEQKVQAKDLENKAPDTKDAKTPESLEDAINSFI